MQKKQRVWVTGATGGLGQAVVRRFLAEGYCVLATGRNTTIGAQLVQQGAQFVALDIAQFSVSDWCQHLRAGDTVIHCAALSSPWGKYEHFHQVNVIGTRHLAAAALQMQVSRLIHVSTPSIYFDFSDRINLNESCALPRPVNFYAKTKLAAETELYLLAAQGLNTVIIRPRAIFGENDTVLMPRLLRAYRNGTMPLIAQGQALIDITHVDNVAHALFLATTVALDFSGGQAKIYNITNGEPMRVRKIFELLLSELDWPVRFKKIPWPLAHNYAKLLQWLGNMRNKEPLLTPYSAGVLAFSQTLDISKARTELGYAPLVSIGQGLARYITWARIHEPLIQTVRSLANEG
jgi:nucleoside-diphosphate-sugar epimerase